MACALSAASAFREATTVGSGSAARYLAGEVGAGEGADAPRRAGGQFLFKYQAHALAGVEFEALDRADHDAVATDMSDATLWIFVPERLGRNGEYGEVCAGEGVRVGAGAHGVRESVKPGTKRCVLAARVSSASASSSVLASRRTSCPCLARIIPSVVPQLVAPTTVTTDIC